MASGRPRAARRRGSPGADGRSGCGGRARGGAARSSGASTSSPMPGQLEHARGEPGGAGRGQVIVERRLAERERHRVGRSEERGVGAEAGQRRHEDDARASRRARHRACATSSAVTQGTSPGIVRKRAAPARGAPAAGRTPPPRCGRGWRSRSRHSAPRRAASAWTSASVVTRARSRGARPPSASSTSPSMARASSRRSAGERAGTSRCLAFDEVLDRHRRDQAHRAARAASSAATTCRASVTSAVATRHHGGRRDRGRAGARDLRGQRPVLLVEDQEVEPAAVGARDAGGRDRQAGRGHEPAGGARHGVAAHDRADRDHGRVGGLQRLDEPGHGQDRPDRGDRDSTGTRRTASAVRIASSTPGAGRRAGAPA